MSEEINEGVVLEKNTYSLTNIINIIKSGTKYLKLVIVMVIIDIVFSIFIWNKIKPHEMETYKKALILLLPSIVIYIFLKLYYSPSPKYHYFLSVLYDDDPIDTKFTHIKNGNYWPFYASASVKINKKEHLFLGGGKDQHDVLLLFDNGEFKNIIEGKGLSSTEKTYSAISIDMNMDGKDDLIIGRSDGVWLYLQQDDGTFKSKKILGSLDKVPLALSVSDYNKDGRSDIYVSYFTKMKNYRGSVFNDPSHNRKNILLQNNSDSKNVRFVDVTEKTKSGGNFNTFTSAFVDLNNDNYPDLVLSNDSGEIEILKNIEGKKFETHIPYDYKGNYMGIAVDDIDNDGDQDLFLTNIGTDVKDDKFAYGDIKKNQNQTFKHVLLRNDGNFRFTEISDKMGISHKGFGWGAVMYDFNLDGNTDLLFSEGFQLNPLHKLYPGVGYHYEQKPGEKMTRKFYYKNPAISQTPLISDINNDGIKDIIWINMGSSVKAYLGKKTNNNNFINIILPNDSKFANSKIVVDIEGGGKRYKENIQGGTGFGSDNMSNHYIGIGQHTKINSIKLYTMDNKEYSLKNPKINSTIRVLHIR